MIVGGRPLLNDPASRNDTLYDPEIRAALLAMRTARPFLVRGVSDDEFPALFRSGARTHPSEAADALNVRLGSGTPHGLERADLAPLFAAGGDAAGHAMNVLQEVEGRAAATPDAERGGRMR